MDLAELDTDVLLEILKRRHPDVTRWAAELWAQARRAGRPHGDADLIIAATAIEAGRALATGNARHFAWIAGLVLEDWRSPATDVNRPAP